MYVRFISSKNLFQQDGMTLIEVVLVIIILAIALPPLLQLFSTAMKDSMTPDMSVIATNLGQSIIEEMRSKKWDELSTGGKMDTNSATIGVDVGEIMRYQYDDVDDYNGLNDSPPKDVNGTSLTDFNQFAVTVGVGFVDNNMNTSVVPTDFKEVTVTVSWNNGNENISLVSMMANY